MPASPARTVLRFYGITVTQRTQQRRLNSDADVRGEQAASVVLGLAGRAIYLPGHQLVRPRNAAGARNVTMLGPMEGAGTRAELDAFIAQHGETP